MADDSDWRLMGQENWLSGRAVRQAEWSSDRPDWDHDHCAFCNAEIAEVKTDHVEYTAGYVRADDNYTWICPPCFEDFRERLAWTIAAPAEPDDDRA
jgi:hypothetical protein